MIPFSLTWGGFAIFWEWEVFQSSKAPFSLRLWGVPFVLFGCYMMVGRFFWDAYQRRNTRYGVSNERVIIVTGGVGGSIRSFALASLSDLSLKLKDDGSGSIQLAPRVGRSEPPALEMIDGARQVYEIIRRAQRGAS